MKFVITNKKTREFWNNDTGWGDLATAMRFSAVDTHKVALPVEGRWVSLWEVNAIQFPRLIAECEACGVFNDEGRMRQVAEEMDLELDEVYEIISRAQKEWDEYKAKN